VVKPLNDYLLALKQRVAETKDLAWDRLPFMSASMYEVPWQNIYGIEATRFRKYYQIIDAVGLKRLPIKIEEFEIHNEIRLPYNKNHALPLETTCYQASWFAKIIKVFLENGVVSAACWLRLLGQDVNDQWQPYPKFYVCAFYALLAGKIEASPVNGRMRMRELFPGTTDPAWLELPVTGEFRPPIDTVEKPVTRSIECIASKQPREGTVRVLLFHHATPLASDEDVVQDPQTQRVTLTLEGLSPGSYQLTAYVVTTDRRIQNRLCHSDKLGYTTFFRPALQKSAEVSADGRLNLVGAQGEAVDIPRHSVYFFEVRKN
jgi:hypothetical protein